jgi:hypothetical protein
MCANNRIKENKITTDFFYGTWLIDSSASNTFTFTKERKAFSRTNSGGMEGHESETTFTYKLALDKKPATIEFNCKTNCPSIFPKKTVAQIEVINSKQVFLVVLDKTGKIIRTSLTKNE